MYIKCLAIDDEPIALQQICDYIQKTPFLELTGKCFNAVEALEFLNSNEVDLIFVDINMPELSGIDFVKILDEQVNFIFTTAYSQYAVESYKVNAIDYLLKPITYNDFLRAANKAEKLLLKTSVPAEHSIDKNFLFIKSEYKLIRINFDEIKYIQGMSEYVKIYLTTGKPIMSLLSLKALELELPKSKFMRVHKSFIVNLNKISIIERNEIVYDDGFIIPVSNQYKIDFQHFIDKNFMA